MYRALNKTRVHSCALEPLRFSASPLLCARPYRSSFAPLALNLSARMRFRSFSDDFSATFASLLDLAHSAIAPHRLTPTHQTAELVRIAS